jgi:hypothetical protein
VGAKTWMLVHSNGSAKVALGSAPVLDREASAKLAKRLFPSEKLEPLSDGTLSFTNPPDDELVVGSVSGVSIVAAKEFAIDRPSQLPAMFLSQAPAGTTYLHAMHSVVDWFAFAVWENGKLLRSLSLSPDSGIVENIGDQLPFEKPFWGGEHPAVDPAEENDYPFPFHPLELGEAALAEFFGYQLEGFINASLLEPEQVALLRFKRTKSSWWKRRFASFSR